MKKRKPHIALKKGVWRVTNPYGWYTEGYTIKEAWFSYQVCLSTPEEIE